MKAVVTKRGQVTIPKYLREKLGIVPGTVLELKIESGRLVGRKQGIDPVSSVIGCLPADNTDVVIMQLRGDV